MDGILISTLENAELSKEEFINKLEVMHGYELKHLLEKDFLNPFAGVKPFLFIDAVMQVASNGHNFAARDIPYILALLGLY